MEPQVKMAKLYFSLWFRKTLIVLFTLTSHTGKRTPINVISAYLDGNPTYGNSDEQAAEFREKGLLKYTICALAK